MYNVIILVVYGTLFVSTISVVIVLVFKQILIVARFL